MKERIDWGPLIGANVKQLLFVSCAFFIMVVIGCVSMSAVIRREALSSVTVALNETEKTLQSYLREPSVAYTNIYMTVQDMLDRGETQTEVLGYFKRTTELMREQQEGVLGFAGVHGFIRGEFLDGAGLDHGDEFIPQQSPWYQLAIRSKNAAYTAPYKDGKTGKTIFTLVREVYGKDGTYYGVLSLNVELSWVFQYVSSLQLSEGSYGMILNQYLYVMAHPNSEFTDKPLQDLGIAYAKIANMLRKDEPVAAKHVRDHDGTSAIVFFRELHNGWYIGVVMPASSYYSDLYMMALILIAFGIALTVALSYLLLRLTADKMQSEENSRSKSSFLAIMSHEIRTPLNAIIGLSEIMVCRDLPEETHSDLMKIYNSGSNLLSIINDILDFSKIEAGGFTLVSAPYDTPSLINDTVQLNMMRITSSELSFNLELDDTLPCMLMGDEVRVKQILNNLLSNAFKYTRDGSITLNIQWHREWEDAVVTFCVTDTGIGIKSEDMDKLFHEYSQVDIVKNRKIEGTGLGLKITKNIIEQMGGYINVESEYGKGSTFEVTIRQRIADLTPIGSTVADNLKKMRFTVDKLNRNKNFERAYMPYARVLVVDDIQTNLDVARGFLSLYGIAVDCVLSGKEAVKLVREESVLYDAIFMDHMMPEMDGVETTRVIRCDIGTDYAKNVPIIALTANALVGNEEMLLGKGFDAFVSKPIDTLRLDEVLMEWIYKRQPEEILKKAERAERTVTPKAATTILSDKSVDGLDLASLARYYENDEACIDVLRSFAKHTPTLLDELRNSERDDLSRYAVSVHGLKGSARNIGAEELGRLAEELEHAAKGGDAEFVAANGEPLVKLTEKLLASLNAMLDKVTAEKTGVNRPASDSIDAELLQKMLTAAQHFDITGMEETMKALESFDYQSDSDANLVTWLRDQLDNLEYDEVIDKLRLYLT